MNKKSSAFNRRDFILTAIGTVASVGRPALAMSENGKFPRSISHFFGVTVIPSKPKRIVTLGWGGEDALLALGIMPVAMPRYSQFTSGVLPWVAKKIGDANPALLGQGLIDFEAIAMLKPDLIMAVRTNLDAQTWRRLQRIAPTVAYQSGPLQADWKEITLLVGAANGLSAQADKLISTAEGQLRELSSRHPCLRDRTFAFGNYFPASNAIDFYVPPDGRVATLVELGLRPAPDVLTFESTQKPGASVSLELLDTIETDILILWFPPGGRPALEGNPLFERFSPAVNGRYIPLDDPLSVWVACNPSVLSIPYGFPQFVQTLAEAALISKRG